MEGVQPSNVNTPRALACRSHSFDYPTHRQAKYSVAIFVKIFVELAHSLLTTQTRTHALMAIAMVGAVRYIRHGERNEPGPTRFAPSMRQCKRP